MEVDEEPEMDWKSEEQAEGAEGVEVQSDDWKSVVEQQLTKAWAEGRDPSGAGMTKVKGGAEGRRSQGGADWLTN